MTTDGKTRQGSEIDEKLLRKLLTQAAPFAEYKGSYAGLSWRRLEEYNQYEEPGSDFRMVSEDMHLTQLYAGLAVYASDLVKYLNEHPRKDAAVFQEAVAAVNAEERPHYKEFAFPYDDPNFPYLAELKRFPKGIAEAADAGKPNMKWLETHEIRHEWTVKAGKRLLKKLGQQLKTVICGKDGPYEKFESGLVGQAALPMTIATQILHSGISPATLWYPVAVYVALLLVKTGLKTYCEPVAPQR